MITGASLAGLAVAGSAAGFLGAILGIGGSVFLVPAMVLFFGLAMRQAVAAGLVAVIATSSSVAALNVERGWANMRLGMVLELATVVGAIAGAHYAAMLPARFLIGLFGALTLLMSILLWRGPREEKEEFNEDARGPLDAEYYDPAHHAKVSYHVRNLPAGMTVAVVAGSISGMLGVGGGIFKVPALHLFCGVPMKAAAATGNFMIGVTAAASAFLYYRRGDMDVVPTSAVVLGVIMGSMAGSYANKKLKDAGVRKSFAVLLVLLSSQMILKAFRG